MKKTKSPTEAQVRQAIEVLCADHKVLAHAVMLLEAGGCKSHLLVAETQAGSGFTSNSRTMPRFIRGMARQAIARMVEEDKKR